jgi:hypothetical protein
MATIQRVQFVTLLLTAALLPQPNRVLSAPIAEASSEIRLNIPDVGQERRRPNEGWCGESSIQMALAYYGGYASQKAINRAGKPAHPDIYEEDVPVAMKALGMEYRAWQGDGLQAFVKWVRDELAAGHPVLLGVKIYPTGHADWAVDHFVLASGCTKTDLTLNTTWGRQEKRSIARLSSKEKGMSFINGINTLFGYSISGLRLSPSPANLKPTRLQIRRIGDKQVELRVSAEKLERGKRYQFVRFTDLAAAQKPDARGDAIRSFIADGPKSEIVETIGLDDARVYRCLAEP